MRMKISVVSFLALLGLSISIVCAEVTTVVVVNPDKTITRIFYTEGKETAQQIQDREGSVISTTGKIRDGVVKEFLEDEKLNAEWTYKNGKPEGLGKEYFPSGELLEEILYKDGKREGICKKYYKSGKLLAERSFKGGKLEGVTKMYYEGGKIFGELSYKDGMLNGECKMYYEEGKLRSIEVYKGNEKIGEKSYDTQGKLLGEIDDTSVGKTSSPSTTQPQKDNKLKGAGKQ